MTALVTSCFCKDITSSASSVAPAAETASSSWRAAKRFRPRRSADPTERHFPSGSRGGSGLLAEPHELGIELFSGRIFAAWGQHGRLQAGSRQGALAIVETLHDARVLVIGADGSIEVRAGPETSAN